MLVEAAGDAASTPVQIKPMLGIDEDMRGWSMLQVLEHNTIVNGAILRQVDHLVNGTSLEGDFDPKKDVMPSAEPGVEELERFAKSVRIYQKRVKRYSNLRKTAKEPHPIFGPFNAHQWHCMIGFHLMIHRKQLESIAGLLKDS